ARRRHPTGRSNSLAGSVGLTSSLAVGFLACRTAFFISCHGSCCCVWRDPEILPWRKVDNLGKRWLGVRSFLLSLSILYRDRFRGTGCRRLCPRAGCSL